MILKLRNSVALSEKREVVLFCNESFVRCVHCRVDRLDIEITHASCETRSKYKSTYYIFQCLHIYLSHLLEVELNTKHICSWTWVKIVVDTAVNLRVETVILCECSNVLYCCEDIQSERAVKFC